MLRVCLLGLGLWRGRGGSEALVGEHGEGEGDGCICTILDGHVLSCIARNGEWLAVL